MEAIRRPFANCFAATSSATCSVPTREVGAGWNLARAVIPIRERRSKREEHRDPTTVVHHHPTVCRPARSVSKLANTEARAVLRLLARAGPTVASSGQWMCGRASAAPIFTLPLGKLARAAYKVRVGSGLTLPDPLNEALWQPGELNDSSLPATS